MNQDKYNIDDNTVKELKESSNEIHELMNNLGLNAPQVNYWLVNHDEINQLAAYQGFPVRYPHWRWGMNYERRNKKDTYFGGKIFELVNHDTPANAYNQISNSIDEHKSVIAHVEAHADFFKNNQFFKDNPKSTEMMQKHANKIQSFYNNPEIDSEKVEKWIDAVLSIQNNINPLQNIYHESSPSENEEESISDMIESLNISEEVERHIKSNINDTDKKVNNPKSQKDLLKYILDNGQKYNDEIEKSEEYTQWQKEIINIIRKESYYFAPQKLTKIMNEGWACVTPNTRIISKEGLIPIKEVVNTKPDVSDSETVQEVYDSNIFLDYDTIKIKTSKGYEIEGSYNHRILNEENKWVRLDELSKGDNVKISGGNNVWSENKYEHTYSNVTYRHPKYFDKNVSEFIAMIKLHGIIKEDKIVLDIDSNKHIDKIKYLTKKLFNSYVKKENDTYIIDAEVIIEFVDEEFDMSLVIPEPIFRSPKEIVSKYVELLINNNTEICNNKLIYKDDNINNLKDLQELLINYGVITNINKKEKEMIISNVQKLNEHININKDILENVNNNYNNNYTDKIVELETSVNKVYDISVSNSHQYESSGFLNHNSKWESTLMTDEGYADIQNIFDYADKQSMVLNSPGLNPYKIGLEIWNYIENKYNRREVVNKLLKVSSITARNFHNSIDFKELNDLLDEHRDMDIPAERNYSLLKNQNTGFIKNLSKKELKRESRYIFETDKYKSVEEAIKDVDYSVGWDKLFEIRETHNDVTFIDAYLTNEFIDNKKYFSYDYNSKTNQMEVSGTDVDSVKKKLLLQITNGGKPTIVAKDNNYNNKGELLLVHKYNGVPLNIKKAKKVLTNIFVLWGKPINLKTIKKSKNGSEKGLLIKYNGDEHIVQDIKIDGDIRADEVDYNTKPDEWLF